MSKGKFGVFAVLAMVLAPCMFNDPDLGSGGAAVAEAEEVHAGTETGTEGVDGSSDGPEASEATENASEGLETSSRPADGDEA